MRSDGFQIQRFQSDNLQSYWYLFAIKSVPIIEDLNK